MLTKTKTKPLVKPSTNQIKAIIEDKPSWVDIHQNYYRIIIGINKYEHSTGYLCYRKDKQYQFVTNIISFDTPKINDRSYIFTENEYENLLDYLAQFDDGTLYTIAKIGKKQIDPYSLLPIIG